MAVAASRDEACALQGRENRELEKAERLSVDAAVLSGDKKTRKKFIIGLVELLLGYLRKVRLRLNIRKVIDQK